MAESGEGLRLPLPASVPRGEERSSEEMVVSTLPPLSLAKSFKFDAVPADAIGGPPALPTGAFWGEVLELAAIEGEMILELDEPVELPVALGASRGRGVSGEPSCILVEGLVGEFGILERLLLNDVSRAGRLGGGFAEAIPGPPGLRATDRDPNEEPDWGRACV